MATQSSILTWKIPWTEEPGSEMGFPGSSDSKESACNATQETSVQFLDREVPLKKDRLPTPVFLDICESSPSTQHVQSEKK